MHYTREEITLMLRHLTDEELVRVHDYINHLKNRHYLAPVVKKEKKRLQKQT
ncbi:hypothetical protein [Alteribacter natronophilus]|uniref:hypothetical protein n=1 Tax=Alteribacter natronophilus TaxID=2583810 RepID=UPI00148602A8|nr:hypothetical protein [Alteribacter natronophilus]